MEWKSTKYGDIRTRTIFAIWPRDCEDGMTRWLEQIEIDEKFYFDLCGDAWAEISARKIQKGK